MNDRYFIESFIGKEDTHDKWLALDSSLDRYVALLLLDKDHRSSSDKEKWRQQIQMHSSFNHSNLLEVWDLLEVEEGPVCVLQYVQEAETVKELLKKKELYDHISETDLALDLLEALSYLHSKGRYYGEMHKESVLVGRHAYLSLSRNLTVDKTVQEDLLCLASFLKDAKAKTLATFIKKIKNEEFVSAHAAKKYLIEGKTSLKKSIKKELIAATLASLITGVILIALFPSLLPDNVLEKEKNLPLPQRKEPLSAQYQGLRILVNEGQDLDRAPNALNKQKK